MSLTSTEIAEWAAVLAAARRDRVGCDPISSAIELTIDDAYAIQRAGTALRLTRGARVVGWKLGYTSLAMRAQMGIDHPNLEHSPTQCRFRLEDNTADGSSAAQVAVGLAIKGIDRLDEVTVVLLHNGVRGDSATDRAASGHPAAGVVWLAGQLAKHGVRR